MYIRGAIVMPFQEILKTILCSVILALPIINFFSLGYLVEVARHTRDWQDGLPRWTNIWKMWIHGLIVFVIAIVYLIPVFIITWFAGSWIIDVIVILLYLPLLASALLHYAMDYSIKDAFRIGEVFRHATYKEFIVGILLAVMWTFILALPSLIPYVGFVWMFLIGYGAILISSTIFISTPLRDQETEEKLPEFPENHKKKTKKVIK